jgi:hypothetical protein
MPLIPLLLGIAPTVASWILGDKTAVAVGQVTDIARRVLGTDDPAAIEAAIARDPAAALEFKRLIVEAEARARADALEAQRIEFDAFRAQLADTASARAQTVALAQAGSALAWGAVLISIVVLAAFGVALWVILRGEIPAGSRDVAFQLLGMLGTMAAGVVAYWVGSSSGSAAKTATIERVVAGRQQ